MTEDGIGDDEIDDELAVIRAQIAYCHLQLGNDDDGLIINMNLIKQRPSDLAVLAVAANNILAARREFNLFDARKKLKIAQNVPEYKLTTRQRQIIADNKALLNLHSTQVNLHISLINPGLIIQKKQAKKSAVNDNVEIIHGKLRKRRRKRKIRLPKNYDPNVQPDPERWLPKQERTAFKKKLGKRFKDREIGRGTQGAAVAAHL